MLTKEQGRARVDRLVDRFRSRLRELRSTATCEAMIRQEFLDPFWEALGWDVRNKDAAGCVSHRVAGSANFRHP